MGTGLFLCEITMSKITVLLNQSKGSGEVITSPYGMLADPDRRTNHV